MGKDNIDDSKNLSIVNSSFVRTYCCCSLDTARFNDTLHFLYGQQMIFGITNEQIWIILVLKNHFLVTSGAASSTNLTREYVGNFSSSTWQSIVENVNEPKMKFRHNQMTAKIFDFINRNIMQMANNVTWEFFVSWFRQFEFSDHSPRSEWDG